MLDDPRSRGVKFQSLIEAIDTLTATGRAMWQMIGVLADQIAVSYLPVHRRRSEIRAAPGAKFGRKVKYVTDLLSVGRSTPYRALNL